MFCLYGSKLWTPTYFPNLTQSDLQRRMNNTTKHNQEKKTTCKFQFHVQIENVWESSIAPETIHIDVKENPILSTSNKPFAFKSKHSNLFTICTGDFIYFLF